MYPFISIFGDTDTKHPMLIRLLYTDFLTNSRMDGNVTDLEGNDWR